MITFRFYNALPQYLCNYLNNRQKRGFLFFLFYYIWFYALYMKRKGINQLYSSKTKYPHMLSLPNCPERERERERKRAISIFIISFIITLTIKTL